jgi:hypothetical protein
MKLEASEIVRGRIRELRRWGVSFIGCTLFSLFAHAPFAVPAEPTRVLVATTYAAPLPVPGRPFSVPGDGDPRAALESALPGDVIELQRDAFGRSPFLPSSGAATAWIYVHSLSRDSIRSDEPRVYAAVPAAPVTAGSTDRAQTAPAPLDHDALLGLHPDRRTVRTEAFVATHLVPRDGSDGGISAKRARGWPMRGGDRANTGHTTASGPAAQAQPLWIFRPDASTHVWRPAVGPDGTIFVTTVLFLPDGLDGRLYALWPDGSVKWQTQLTNSAGQNVWASATPVVDRAGNIYIAWAHDRDFGGLTAISLDESGNVRWRFEPNIELETASHQQPSLGEAVLYAAMDTAFFLDDATQRASIFALDLDTGTPVWHWSSPNQDTFFDGPAVGNDGYLYHASAANPLRGASGYLYRIRPTGELDWSVDIGAGVIQAPPVVDGHNDVYVGTATGVALKYNSAGDELWRYDTLSGQTYMSPALNGPRVTVGAADAGLHALDADTGEREAVFAPDCYPFGQASDRAGNAFFYCFNGPGAVYGFGPGGRQLWTFDTGLGASVNAVAIARNGTVLVGNSETLQAYVAPVSGDLNCDRSADALDIGPFFLALADPDRHGEIYPQCDRSLADVNGDGAVDVSDLIPFVGSIGGTSAD